jgi:iron complex outermembrane receptor protein
MRERRRALAFWLGLALAAPAWAVPDQTIRGKVVDASGAPVEGARVVLRDARAREQAVSTEASGAFAFVGVQTGRVVVSASRGGFRPARRALTLPAPEAAEVALTLEAAGLQETVVVIGSDDRPAAGHPASSDLPTSVDVLSADQFAHENVDEALEVLKRVPGLYLGEFNQGVISADLGIRGFNTEGDVASTKLLIDGIPSNLNVGFNDMKAVFPLEIERVELVKGTNDPRYGLHNIAGNVNVFTRRGGRERALKLLYGSYETAEAQASAGFEHGRFSHNYFGAYRDSDGYRDHSAQDKHALSGKWFYAAPGDRLTLGVIGRSFELDAEAPGYLTGAEAARDPRASPVFSSSDGGRQTTRHGSFHLDAAPASSLLWSLKAYRQSFYRQRFVRFTAAGTQQERIEDEAQTGALTTLTFRPRVPGFRELALAWGADYQAQQNVHQRHRTGDRQRQALLRDHDFDFHYGGSFVQADGRPSGRLRFTAGLRFDRVGGEFLNRLASQKLPAIPYGTIWQPKLGAVVTPHERFNVYGNWGRSFQVSVGIAAFGQQDLRYSKNDGFELGVRGSASRWLAGRAAVWRQTATDEVRLKFDNSGDSENIGETDRRGFDVELTLRPNDRLFVWAAYTRQRGRMVGTGAREPQFRGKLLDHVPDYTLKLGADAKPWRRVTLSLWSYVQGDYHLTKDNLLPRFGEQALLHLDALFEPGRLGFGVHLKNLLDRRYDSTVWFDGATIWHGPGDGRAVCVTASLKL